LSYIYLAAQLALIDTARMGLQLSFKPFKVWLSICIAISAYLCLGLTRVVVAVVIVVVVVVVVVVLFVVAVVLVVAL